MATIGRAKTSNSLWRAVRIGWIAVVAVLSHYIVFADVFRQIELAFAVSYPDAELRTCQAVEHNRVVLRNGYAQEVRFELVAIVVLHARALAMLRIDEVKFYHHLATVAYTKAQGVGARVEALDGFLCLFVPKDAASPAFSRTKNVAIRESAAEHYHVHVVESLASRYEVSHVHVLNIKSCIIE